MFVNSKEAVAKPIRITRIVSVILNGVVLNKLATQHGHDVDAMAETLMLNLSGTVQRNILSHEVSHVNHSLRKEIDRRISLSQAIYC
ncbi:MAG: hypothetical protein FD147_1712 [Chloroflexi bacterium]|nr:MAG: hypothetical protein FD147_1712 [Chloroflexota bacterium]